MPSNSVVLLILAGAALASPSSAQQSVGAENAIESQIKGLRGLPDDSRAGATRNLALEVRRLPPGRGKVALAVELSSLATEGDFGRDTLQQVVNTLATALQQQNPQEGDPQGGYAELARVVHYEHVPTTMSTPRLNAALASLEDDDRQRQEADFTLTDLNAKSWTLKQLRGRVVLVNFWATWCPPCRKEMPDLETLSHRFAGNGLVILAISDEDRDKVAPFIANAKYSYPVLLDPGRTVNQRFRIQGIPKTLVYARDGKLVAQSADMRTMAQFLAMLEAAGLK
jgi:thiol-disulfide isomerase/thioredoxin